MDQSANKFHGNPFPATAKYKIGKIGNVVLTVELQNGKIFESGDLFIDGNVFAIFNFAYFPKIPTFWQNRQSSCHEKVLIVTLSINKATLSFVQ